MFTQYPTYLIQQLDKLNAEGRVKAKGENSQR
jgi:hypothetical protein